MKSTRLKSWLKKAIITLTATTFALQMAIPAAHAFTLIDLKVTPNITKTITVTPKPKDNSYDVPDVAITDVVVAEAQYGGHFIDFCLNTDAYVTLGIYESTDAGNYTVKMLATNDLYSGVCYSSYWDGEDEDGDDVDSDADVFYWIKAVNKYLPNDVANDSGWIEISDNNNNDEEDLIDDLEVSDNKFDPQDGEEVEITFELTEDVEELTVEIYTKNTNKLIKTLEDDEDFDEDDYTYKWNGKDKDGDIVEDDDYKIKVSAETDDGEEDLDTIMVEVKEGSGGETEDARLEDVFVTKKSFDPGAGEKTYVVFTTTSESDVTVKIYDEDDEEVNKLYNKKDVDPGTYIVAWDGEDEDNENLPEGDYTYEIKVKNSEGSNEEEGKIEIEDDDEWVKVSNIYKDRTSPIVFEPKDDDDEMEFEFKISKDAYTTVAVYDAGKLIATVYEGELEDGSHDIDWDGVDRDGDIVDDGVYDYKITTENNQGESKEDGKFQVKDSKKSDKKDPTNKCAGFKDVFETNPACDAIEWTEENNIFEGYAGGEFKPAQPINRVEALKVILLTLDFNIMSDNGSSLGYYDVTPGSWYMKYVRTAKTNGVAKGYIDGSFKPNKQIIKAEALVMLLRAAEIKSDLVVPSCNVNPYKDVAKNAWHTDAICYAKYDNLTNDSGSYFNPKEKFARADMAQLLYNFYKAGLID
jgi:flagellar hook assembly protein FlgD